MKRLAFAALGLALIAGPALAGGYYTNGLPAATSPLTGAETIPADTNLSGGQAPQSESVTISQLTASGSGRNALFGSDFGTNPWQRGTSPCTTVTSTLTYCADGWFVKGAAGSAITVAKRTTLQPVGFGGSLRFQRDSGNTDINPVYLAQVLESVDSYRFQGQQVAFSFYAKVGANYSPTGSAIGVVVATGTGVDGSAANFISGGWTGYAAASCSVSGGTVSTSPLSFTLSATWTRYTAVCTIPATAVQVGVRFVETPTGTASTNDWVEFDGMQLESVLSGSTIASGFNFIPEDAVWARAFRYYYRVNEGATTVNYFTGQAYTTTVAHFQVTFPAEMRAAPTATITAGSFTVSKSDGTTQALTTLASTASSLTVLRADLTATASAANLAAGNATVLQGGGGVGVLAYSSEL